MTKQINCEACAVSSFRSIKYRQQLPKLQLSRNFRIKDHQIQQFIKKRRSYATAGIAELPQFPQYWECKILSQDLTVDPGAKVLDIGHIC